MTSKSKFVAPMVALAIVGSSGLALIKSHEGLRNATYIDPVGIPTICYGHTGPDVRMGQRLSDAQCETILMQDIAAHQAVIAPGNPRNCIGNAPLNPNQRDAVTSFVFNVGTTKFCKSTMAARLKGRDYAGASLEFSKWANGRVNGKLTKLPGLVKRRTAEKQLFLTPTAAATAEAPHGALRAILRMFG